MTKDNIIVSWFFWHFYETPKFLARVWHNFFLFSLNFFSTPLLLKTLLSPWRRYKWTYPKGFDVKEFFNTLISNFFSRILGALCRLFLIIAGIFLQVFVIIFGAILFVGWLILPLLIIYIIFSSLNII